MNIDPHMILLAISWLSVKHFFADFVFQTQSQFKNKHIYGHWGGLLHAGIHGVCSIPLFAILPASGLSMAFGLIGGEVLVHYHLDWLKKNLCSQQGAKHQEQALLDRFWVRSITPHDDLYSAMIYVLVR